MGRATAWCVVGLLGLLACGPGNSAGARQQATETPPEPEADAPAPDTSPDLPPYVPELAGTHWDLPRPGEAPTGSYPPVQSRVPTLALEVAPELLARLEADPTSDDEVPCAVTLDGVKATGQVRYRGASTRTLPQKSYKLELDPGQELGDRDHFELLASYADGGKLTEKFATDLYLALGLPVPRARYVRVTVNGVPQGLYLDMEHVGKDWLKHHGRERDASIYRCGHGDCELTPAPGPGQQAFDKKTNEDTGREDLDALLAWVNRSDDADFVTRLERHVDVEAYLGNLAADALISNGIIEESRSFWVHELHEDRWTYVPWDLNNAMMLFWRGWKPESPPLAERWPQSFTAYDPEVQTLFEYNARLRSDARPAWSVLATRIWDQPALRDRLVAKLEAALDGPFSEAKAMAHVDALFRVVESELREDPYVSPEHASHAAAFLKTYVHQRRAFLLKTLDALRKHGEGPLVIREVVGGSAGSVELYNRGSRPLALERYEVTNDARARGRHALPKYSLGPGKAVRLRLQADTRRGELLLPFPLSEEGGEVAVFNGARRSEATGGPLLYGPEDLAWYGPARSPSANATGDRRVEGEAGGR